MKVKLPIFYNTSETFQKEKLEKQIDHSEYMVLDVVFMKIDKISPLVDYKNGDIIIGSVIVCNGDAYESPMFVEDVEKMISRNSGIIESIIILILFAISILIKIL